MFNKAIRKFTKLFKDVYQKEIEDDIAEEETKDAVKLGTLLAKVKDNKQAIVSDEGLKQTLHEELATKGTGTQMALDLEKEK